MFCTIMKMASKDRAVHTDVIITLVCYVLILCCIHAGYAEVQTGGRLSQDDALRQALCNDQNGTSFNEWTGDCMSELFMKYGKDGKLEYEGFTQLLENVGLGAVRDSVPHPTNHESNVSRSVSKRMADRTNSMQGLTSARQEREAVNSTAVKATNWTTHDEHHLDHHETRLQHTEKCLSPEEILGTFSLIPSEGIIPFQFLQLCPILLQQLDSHACIVYDVHGHNHTDEPAPTPAQEPANLHPGQLWGYSIGAVTMISVASVTCIMMVPCIQRFPLAYGRLLSFLVAMAVGTLSGDSVLHLLPHAFGIHGHEETEASTLDTDHLHETHAPASEADKHLVVWRGCVVLVGIFSFFIFEQTMRMCKKRPKKRLISLVEEPPSQREISCHSNHSDEASYLATPV